MVTKCEENQSRTRLSLGLLVLATILVWVVTGCGGGTPTPIAAVQPPEISEPKVGAPTPLKPGEEVGISVDVSSATGVTLTYTWHADGGEIVRGKENPAITYRAPEEPGTYNVRVVVEWDGQSVEKATSIKVEAKPTPEPTEEPTPELTEEPTLEPTEEPTPAATPIPDTVVVAPVNLRSGPGTMYDIIGALSPGQVLTVAGRNEDATWLQVNTDQVQGGWVANRADLVTLNLPPGQIPTVSPPPTPTPPPADFIGKVCQIREGWDENAIFLRQAEFNALGLPIGTRVTVAVLDTGKSVGSVTLSLNSDLEVCSVRLARRLREALGVDIDTAIEPERDRPDRQFDITQTSPPTNKEAIDFQGKVCQIKSGQDTNTVFLRQVEYNAFGVPAGTTVNVTVLDTGKTVEKVTLGLDSDIAICSVRLSKPLRVALGVDGDTAIEPETNRPDRQFSIRLLQP